MRRMARLPNQQLIQGRRGNRRPDLAGAVFVGDAGVGKSHLLQATLRHAEEAGFVTVFLIRHALA